MDRRLGFPNRNKDYGEVLRAAERVTSSRSSLPLL